MLTIYYSERFERSALSSLYFGFFERFRSELSN